MTIKMADTLLALNIWIDKYDLVIEDNALYVMVQLCKKDILKMGRIRVTDSVAEILELLVIPREEIDYVLWSDTSIRLEHKMFSLFCKSPLFKPEIIRRSSFKQPHPHQICKKYEEYVLEKFDVVSDDEDETSNAAWYMAVVDNLKQRHPRVREQFERLREQSIVYDTIYDALSPEERSDENAHRLFDIFVRFTGMRELMRMALGGTDKIKKDWDSFKAKGSTNAEDWQCLFLGKP